PAFGSPTTATPSFAGFANQAKPTFGTPTASGGGGTTPFGSTSGLGNRASLWGTSSGGAAPQATTSTFGTPAFVTSTSIPQSAAFGQAGGLGQRQSPWSASAAGSPNSSTTFGQTSVLGMRTGGVF